MDDNNDADLCWTWSMAINSDADVCWTWSMAINSDADVCWTWSMAINSDADVCWTWSMAINSDADICWTWSMAINSDADVCWTWSTAINYDAGVRWEVDSCDDVSARFLRSLCFNTNKLRADVCIVARCVLSGTDIAPALARSRSPAMTFDPSKRTRQWNGPSRDMFGACGWPQNLVSIWRAGKWH